MKLFDLLCALRQRLLDAMDANDRVLLEELKTTFTILREASYESENAKLIEVIVALEDTARDAVMGLFVKGEVPSVEAIKKACEVDS